MNYSQPYWNLILETLPPETLRVLQLKKFQRIFRSKDVIEWAAEPCAVGRFG